MPTYWTTQSGIKALVGSTNGSALDYGESSSPSEGNMTTILATVPWAQRVRFRRDVLGYARPSGNGFTRVIPEVDPANGNGTRYGHKCELVKAFPASGQDANGFPVFETAVYKVVFATVPYPILSDSVAQGTPSGLLAAGYVPEMRRFNYRRRKLVSREMQVPGGAFILVGQSKPIAQTGFVIAQEQEVTYTWYGIPRANVPYATFDVVQGFVNNVTFDHRPPGTMLLHSITEEHLVDAYDQKVSDITFVFRYRPQGWNAFPAVLSSSPPSLGWTAVTTDGSADTTTWGTSPATPPATLPCFTTGAPAYYKSPYKGADMRGLFQNSNAAQNSLPFS
jgi:hypothetical protein